MSKNFDAIMEKVTAFPMKKLAVAVAQDKAVLEAVKAAKERGIADSILVGDADEIKKMIDSRTYMGVRDYADQDSWYALRKAVYAYIA